MSKATPETRETRLKRLAIRSWRRGTREMDLILGGYADACLSELGEDRLAAYEELLEENDQDLYAWVAGTVEASLAHRDMVERIANFHRIR
ncbi:MAG: succinate dehydrogenase assembly factor 2 [Pseudomonadota bacterium]